VPTLTLPLGTRGGEASPKMAAPAPVVKFGITPPVSDQSATEQDNAQSERMMEELENEFPAETRDGMAHRQSVLEELEQIIEAWMAELAAEQGLSKEDARGRCAARMVTLGSYRLGVVHPESDIDTLLIGPPHVSREAFFGAFVEKLKRHEHITECIPIPDAYTPIVKLKVRGVSIDLLFARLAKPLTDCDNLEEAVRDDSILKNMDDKSVRCINGVRVADQILQLVPNKETFRRTLRFVKCWARRRGIYSNVLGFFGGITWALLVARVCQLYPHYAPSQLVNRFFRVYDQWNWSRAVMLCEIVERQNDPSMADLKVWNPKTNPADRQHLMPVITPAFPAMNSTHNVTETTKRILLDEFRRGYEVVKSVEAHRGQWTEVHDPFPSLTHFRHFLWLEILAKTDEIYQKFSGWVESKLRILIKHLETVNGMIIHPNPEQYALRGSDSAWPFGCGMFIAMAFFKDQGAFLGQTVDLRSPLAQFVDVVSQWSENGPYSGQFLLRLKRIGGQQLPSYALQADEERKRPRAGRPEGARPEAKRPRLPNGSP